MTLTCEDLDGVGCGVAHCDHDHSVLFFRPRCHPRAGVEVAYYKVRRSIRVECDRCHREVATIAVAAAPVVG